MEEEWTVDANEAVTISLVTPTDNGFEKVESFHPKFTYPIFGEEERIFGYKGLKVNISYNASDMRPNLAISYSRKFSTVSGVEAHDVLGTMKEFLPGVAFQKKADFTLGIQHAAKGFQPPGELVKSIDRDGHTYEIWKGSLADKAVSQLVNRVQICVLFYIEGGSYIGQDAEGNEEPEYSLARWTVYFLYKKQPITDREGQYKYAFLGYSTVYNFWLFEPPTPPATPREYGQPILPTADDSWELPNGDLPYSDIAHRARISQFVILPPFQGQGCGAMLYNTIFELQAADSTTKEITVEDPNEAFDLLRDLCDLKYLRRNVPEFAQLTIKGGIPIPEKGGLLTNDLHVNESNDSSSSSSVADSIVDRDALESLRVQTKIAPRQWSRLVEMHLMSGLPSSVRPRSETSDFKKAAQAASATKADRNRYALWRLVLKQRIYRRNATLLGEFEATERIIKLNETLENVEWEYSRILERLDAPRPSSESNGKRKLEELGDANGEESSKKARVEPS